MVTIQRQEGHLLDGTALLLGALGEKKDGKKHRKSEAHENGDSEDFHTAAKEAETVRTCSPRLVGRCTDLVK